MSLPAPTFRPLILAALLIAVVPRPATTSVAPATLDLPAAWQAEGNGNFGESVDSAGDVNGDGYEDLIVGSRRGGAFLYLGSVHGPAVNPSWSFGASGPVSGAGDINGDGFDDVIVGTEFEDRVYVFLGSATGLGTSPSRTLTSSGDFGSSVSGAGDVNGDGFDDVIVGAHQYSNGETGEGRALVYLGSASGLAATPAWAVESNVALDHLGVSVAAAGDLNGDGFADVVIGSSSFGGPNVFVYLGSSTGLATVPVWTANSGSHGGSPVAIFAAGAGDVNGDTFGDLIVAGDSGVSLYAGGPAGPSTSPLSTLTFEGNAVGSAGDANGDGFGDVVIGSPYGPVAEPGGSVTLCLGSASGLVVPCVWHTARSQDSAFFGFSVAGVDSDGDGSSSILVGAPLLDDLEPADGADDGAAFLYVGVGGTVCNDLDGDGYGSPGNLTCPAGDAQDCDNSQSQIHPGASETCNGRDDDCDGLWDEGFRVGQPCSLALGACATFGVNVCATDGTAMCDAPAPGQPSEETCDGLDNDCDGVTDNHLADPTGCPPPPLNTAPTWQVEPADPGTLFGKVVATAGDVNGDGFSDVLVSAPNFNDPRTPVPHEGGAFIYLGSAAGPSTVPVWSAGGAQLEFGAAAASAGDVNGDGFDDVVIGEPDPFFASEPGGPLSYQGQVSVFYGSPSGPGSAPDLVLHDSVNFSRFGAAVASAGDVNGDGFDDVIIGAPSPSSGRAFVYLGSASGLGATAVWTTTGAMRINGLYGESVASAGDVNGDGFADVLVGEPWYMLTRGGCPLGRAVVYLGSPTGLSTTPAWTRLGDGDPDCPPNLFTFLGNRVASAGDVNGDGFSDILLGGSRYGTLLFLGSPSGPGTNPSWSASSGGAVGAGDVNGDHYDDVVRGDPEGEGKVFIHFGSPAGLSPTADLIGKGDQPGAQFGASVASAGDTDGDGRANVLVGAPLHDQGGLVDLGAAFLLFGPRVFACVDVDHDGYCAAGPSTDCNDSDPGSYPAAEICNGIDEDCNNVADDNLGITTCGTGACQRAVDDCVAGVPQTCTPGTPGTETCNNIDDDCDGSVDDDLGSTTCGTGACQRTVSSCVACIPGNPGTETCNNIDDDCDGVVDQGIDCQAVVATCISNTSPLGKGSGTVSWRTQLETDLVGFNIITVDNQGSRTQMNPVLIPCEECVTLGGHTYTFVVPKHKSGHNIYIEMLRLSGAMETFGPAVKDCTP